MVKSTGEAAGQQRADSGPSRRRLALHLLVILGGWALYIWGWQRVASNQPEFGDIRALVLGAALVVAVVTLSWIAHNRGIHRRKGPRQTVPSASMNYDSDFNGRRIQADWPALKLARYIEIVIDGADKQYRQQSAP